MPATPAPGKVTGTEQGVNVAVNLITALTVHCADGAASPNTNNPSHSAGQNQDAQPITSPSVVYVSDSSFDVLRVIDATSGAAQATVQLPSTGTPSGVAITPDGQFVWVVQKGFAGSPGTPSSIQIIDTSSNQITGAIALPPLVSPSWIAMLPDGKTAYVSNEGYDFLANTMAVDSILILDVASRTIKSQIPSPRVNTQIPSSGYAHFDRLAVSPDGTLLYATTQFALFVFDTLTNTQIYPNPSSTLPLPDLFSFAAEPLERTQILLHPNGAWAYYSSECPPPNGGSACLAVVNTTTNAIVKSVVLGPNYPTATEPVGLGISADGQVVYVKEFKSGDVIPINTVSYAVGKHIPGDANAYALFFDAPPQ